MYRQPRYRLKRKVRFFFIAIVLLSLMAGGVLWAAGFFDNLDVPFVSDLPEPDAYEGRINVLVIGTDTRNGEEIARADTIMLCSVDTEKNLISILSIPRDTRVNIPGHGYDKINSSTIYGGPSMAMKTVSNLLGIRINKYAMIDYKGFKNLVDALGGVTMNVEQRMYHYDPDDGGAYTIDLYPGVQKLDGNKALQFVRYRSYALGDIQRAEQQQKFLTALIKEVLQPSTVVKLPSIVLSTYKDVKTNLSLNEIRKLAVAAKNMTDSTVQTQTLPGKFLNYNGISYWEADPVQTRYVVAAMMEGQIANSKVVLGEETINTRKTEDNIEQPNGTPSNEEETYNRDSGNNSWIPDYPDYDDNTGTGSSGTGSNSNNGSSQGQQGGSGSGSGGYSGGIVPPSIDYPDDPVRIEYHY